MLTVENRVGRLVEIRIATPTSAAELQQFQADHAAAVARVDGGFVAAVDLRGAHVFQQEIAGGFIQIMSSSNPRLVRSAFLMGRGAVFSLQAERAIRQAANPNRKVFYEPGDLEGWLAEVLDGAERGRLRDFLAVGAL